MDMGEDISRPIKLHSIKYLIKIISNFILILSVFGYRDSFLSVFLSVPETLENMLMHHRTLTVSIHLGLYLSVSGDRLETMMVYHRSRFVSIRHDRSLSVATSSQHFAIVTFKVYNLNIYINFIIVNK
jgi:hypothetical protein